MSEASLPWPMPLMKLIDKGEFHKTCRHYSLAQGDEPPSGPFRKERCTPCLGTGLVGKGELGERFCLVCLGHGAYLVPCDSGEVRLTETEVREAMLDNDEIDFEALPERHGEGSG